ncbi:hypothetical protein D0Z00_004210 [Geotrichum galactomycetum]|uniref:Uncharacterized protein n=1 Tax=Geotrichum galactomycetum TaxID=27317 RepID=A0ACB6UZ33_9ASCO|nr:hypothetical protein D0Z00_004210 [Geotrichum candidum]
MSDLISFQQFLAADKSRQSHTLSLLFEPCEALQNLILTNLLNSEPKSFSSYIEFIEAVRKVLLLLLKTSSTEKDLISKIIAAHPRLGAKKVESKLSQAEQASLQSNAEEAQILAELNSKYETTFPGLRYVVFVNGRSRPEIYKDMKTRIDRGSYDLECEEAFNAMCDITIDRVTKLSKI